MDHDQIRRRLDALAEPAYRDFSAKLLPGVTDLLGVRLPALRRIARELARDDWQAYLSAARDDSFEERMLQGMVLGYAPGDLAAKRPWIDAFLPKIDNWSVCDSFCNTLTLAKTEPAAVWDYLQPKLQSSRPYDVRFAVVQLLCYYVNSEYLAGTLSALASVQHPDYYVKMAMAWTVSVCYVNFPDETGAFLRRGALEPETHRLAVRKICESRRVTPAQRAAVRAAMPAAAH